MVNFIILASAGVIFFVSVYLAMCRRYDDGIIGHVSLFGMALSSAAPLYESIEGADYDFLPTTALLYASVAVFMARHLYIFETRSRKRRNDKEAGNVIGRRAN